MCGWDSCVRQSAAHGRLDSGIETSLLAMLSMDQGELIATDQPNITEQVSRAISMSETTAVRT